MSDPRDFGIQRDGYRAEVSNAGGALRLLEHDAPDGAYRLTESWPAGERPPLYSGVVLAPPWPGRVRDGHFFFDGIEHQLALTDPQHGAALHGFAWSMNWEVLSHSETKVVQALEVGVAQGLAVPVAAHRHPRTGAGRLTVTHTTTNIGGYHAPPFGLGAHPYLRAGASDLDDCTCRSPPAPGCPSIRSGPCRTRIRSPSSTATTTSPRRGRCAGSRSTPPRSAPSTRTSTAGYATTCSARTVEGGAVVDRPGSRVGARVDHDPDPGYPAVDAPRARTVDVPAGRVQSRYRHRRVAGR